MTEEIPLSPVTGWTSSTITAYGCAFIEFNYLVSPMESLAQAHSSPRFVLMPAQLRELAQRMVWLADQLETGPIPGTGLPKN